MDMTNQSQALPGSSTPDQATLDAKFFQGLADSTRVAILELLLTGERNVSEIVAAVGGSQSRISNHLACLRWCGFVTTERRGLYIYYQVSDPRVRQILRLGQALAREHEAGLRTCLRLQPPGETDGDYVDVDELDSRVPTTPGNTGE